MNLPAETPIDRLLPSVLAAAGVVTNDEPVEPEGWRLACAAGGDHALSPHSSLEESGILPGATLFLSRKSGSNDGRGLAVEPPRHGLVRRVAKTIAAFFAGTRAPRTGEASESPDDPSGPAAPAPVSLTALPSLTRVERARQVWRASDHLEQLDALIAGPRLARCVTIAVVSPKGGVGKTTITGLLGMLLSMLRQDRVVAVDANPDYGSLGRTLVPDHGVFVDDFLDRIGGDAPAATVESQLGRAQHGLLVLPAPTDPARMWGLREPEYARIIARLQQFVGVLLLDCGTGLQDPSTSAAMNECDQCVLVTDADPAAASLVAEGGRLIAGSGRPITVVVNKVPAKRSFLALERFEAAVPFATAVTVIRNEPHAAGQLTTGQFGWRGAPKTWQLGMRRLAVALASDWAALGLTVRP
jgi:MinD-like ATPase involved in chromosome partitioning or flagellar assembly